MDTLNLDSESTDGGTLAAYCDGDSIRLLVAEYYGESGDATRRFYFDRDSVFFVFSHDERGHRTRRTPYPPRTIIEDERFYFVADRLIRWLDSARRSRDVTSSEARGNVQSLLSDAQRLYAVMPGCRPKYAPADSVPTER